MLLTRRTLLASGMAAMAPLPALAGTPVAELNLSSSGLALRGVDVVSYFTEGKPLKGSKNITVSHGGGTYRFASEAHRDLFKANPNKYLPAYGGFCSYGTAVNAKVDGDPYIWHIIDDRLYLNITRSVDRVWRRDIPGYIRQADRIWPKIKHNKP